MTVSLTWAASESGSSLSSYDHGNSANGTTTNSGTSGTVLYFSHNGISDITGLGVYLTTFEGTYDGDASAVEDYNEVVAWGDGSGDGFGGFQVNFNAADSFPDADWQTIMTGTGDSVDNPITVAKEAMDGSDTDGKVVAGTTDNSIKTRFKVPNSEGTIGVRKVNLKTRFDYTS